MKHLLRYLFLTGMLLWSASAQAATYYVAQQAPNSADSNPGTEAEPWKTLTHACAAARAGDIVWVKAGVYTETLSPQCDGLTVKAYGDDQVVITPPRILLADPAAWTKVPGTKSVYQYVSASDKKVVIAPATTPEPGQITPTPTAYDELVSARDPQGRMLRADGLALQFLQTYGDDVYIDAGDGQTIIRELNPLPLDTMERHWTRTLDGHIQVNLGGDNPATHRLEVSPVDFVGIHLATKGCLVRGIEVRDAQTGIRVDGSDNVVQFCVVRGAYYGSFFTGPASIKNTLFACAFLDCNFGIDVEDVTGYHLFDSNLIVGTGYQSLTNRTAQRDFSQPWGMGTSLRYGNTHQNIFRYNTVTEGTFAGWWPDVNCYGNYLYGNAFTRIRDRALYNEYPVNDSKILYNAITDCDTGICSRFSWRMFVMHNYVAGNDVAVSLWGPHVDNPYVFDNFFARNLFADSNVYLDFSDDRGVASGLPIKFESDGQTSATGRFRSFSNIFTGNTYKGPARDSFAVLNENISFPTLERFQEATGEEPNGRFDANARMEDQGLGLYTVRIPESARPDEAVAIVGNPMTTTAHVDPIPVAAEDAPYFWSQGDFTTMQGGEGWQYNMGAHYEWPHYGTAVRRLIRSLPGADPTAPFADGDAPRVWLECIGAIPEEIPAGGSGFWSPVLTTVPGAQIALSWQMYGLDLEPIGEHGGPVAYVRFQSLTGQQTQDVVVLGRQADAVIADGRTDGTFDWQRYTGEVTAPATAERFSVFLGMRPGKGTVRFGGIYITTAPGPAPVAPTAGEQTFTPLDLTAQSNRKMDEDTGAAPGAPPADRLKTNRRAVPRINLSQVTPGTITAAGVPFTVQDRVISLGCFQRPPVTLPMEALGIPVGRKVTSLNFLHAGPWSLSEVEYWRYLVHYADGMTAEVVPVSDPNLLVYKHPFFDQNATLNAAMSIGRAENPPNPEEAAGGRRRGRDAGLSDVICWINPRPEVAVQSVDFRTMNLGQAVMVAVTAGESR